MSRWRDHDSWLGSLDDYLTRVDDGESERCHWERFAGDICGPCYSGHHGSCRKTVHGEPCWCYAGRHFDIGMSGRLKVVLDE